MKGKMERKEYNFKCGLKAYQEELSLEQDHKLAKIFKEHNIDSLGKLASGDFENLLQILNEENLIERILQVILIEVTAAENTTGRATEIGISTIQKLKNREVKQVFVDFFTSHPEAQIILNYLNEILVFVRKYMMTITGTAGSASTAQEQERKHTKTTAKGSGRTGSKERHKG